MTFSRLIFLCLLPLMVLTGCMSLPNETALESYQGRFSVTVKQGSANTHETGRFELALYPKDRVILDLKSPLGGTVARIEKTQDLVQLKALAHETIEAENVDQLLLQTIGFSVPIDGLPFWIKGEVDPTTPYETKPVKAPFERIQQNGWCIDIVARNADQSPKRLRISRAPTINEPGINLTLLILGNR